MRAAARFGFEVEEAERQRHLDDRVRLRGAGGPPAGRAARHELPRHLQPRAGGGRGDASTSSPPAIRWSRASSPSWRRARAAGWPCSRSPGDEEVFGLLADLPARAGLAGGGGGRQGDAPSRPRRAADRRERSSPSRSRSRSGPARRAGARPSAAWRKPCRRERSPRPWRRSGCGGGVKTLLCPDHELHRPGMSWRVRGQRDHSYGAPSWADRRH